MPWFSRKDRLRDNRPNQPSRPITRRYFPRFDELEERRLLSQNVWLPRQLQPLNGVNQDTQSFQLFQPSLTDVMPTLELNSGTVTLGGNFSLTDSGGYLLAYAEAGPFDSNDSFAFTESGPISFALTEQGNVTLGGFSVTSTTLTQTVSLGWSFVETDAAGNTVQNLTVGAQQCQ
jgi:hypothetical protein